MIIKNINIIPDEHLILTKPEYPVNWYAFKHSRQCYAQLYCVKCIKEYYSMRIRESYVFLAELGTLGDTCKHCLQVTNIPPNPFDHLPMSCQSSTDLPSHNERDFYNAIKLVTLDVGTYQCYDMYLLDTEELLTMHRELLEDWNKYVRPDILVATVNLLFAQKLEQMRVEFGNWNFLGRDLLLAIRSLKSGIKKRKEFANELQNK